MKQFLIFIGGFVVGAIVMYSVIYTSRSRSFYTQREMLVEKMMSTLNKEAQVQYIEIKGKNGNVIFG